MSMACSWASTTTTAMMMMVAVVVVGGEAEEVSALTTWISMQACRAWTEEKRRKTPKVYF